MLKQTLIISLSRIGKANVKSPMVNFIHIPILSGSCRGSSRSIDSPPEPRLCLAVYFFRIGKNWIIYWSCLPEREDRFCEGR
jgi:hypothetical protein